MAVDKTMHDAAKRAMMLEETAKVLLCCNQFGGERASCRPRPLEGEQVLRVVTEQARPCSRKRAGPEARRCRTAFRVGNPS
jgi:ribulose-5-phosphate 4-epimerase/fuculose-1-phosphate aldolase